MSSIVTNILSSTVSLLWNKARDTTADRLKDGDVTDAKIREIIVRDMSEIKTKLDGLTRKDLRSSYNFLQEGVDFLNVSLQKSKINQKALTNETQDNRGETSTMPSRGQPEILSEAIELSQAMGKLKCCSNKEYESAKKRFKDARKKATEAFSTETLVLKDMILAAKLRVVSEMLECLDYPETAITGSLSFLKNFHSSPAIQEMFSVYFDGGIKSMLNKSERLENVKSVILINYVLFQYLSKFSSKCWYELVLSMPAIDLSGRSFSPIADWQEVATRMSMGNELTPPASTRQVLIDKEFYLFDPFVSAVNGHGDVIICRDKRSEEILVLSSKTGECKVVKLPEPRVSEFIKQEVIGLAVDNNNNVYVVVRLEESVDVTSFVLYILDENYHCVKDDPCPLNFLKTRTWNVSIAVNKSNIIIKDDDHVYICDDTGKLQRMVKHETSLLSRLCISEQNEIITSSFNKKVMVTFTEEGNLKSEVKLPEGHIICGVSYHYVIRKVTALSLLTKNNSYFLLSFNEDGELEPSTFFRKETEDFKYPNITSHASGPVAVVTDKSITFI